MKGRDQNPESRKHRAGDKPDELSSGGQQHDRRQQAPLAEAPGEGVTTEENAADDHNHLSAPIEPVWKYKRGNRETIEIDQAVMRQNLLDADQAADKSREHEARQGQTLAGPNPKSRTPRINHRKSDGLPAVMIGRPKQVQHDEIRSYELRLREGGDDCAEQQRG